MAADKPIIPPKAQLPVMLVLTVVMVLVLWWRFAPAENAATASPLVSPQSRLTHTTEVPTEVQRAPLDDLKAILAEMKRSSTLSDAQLPKVPQLARDPFEVREEAIAEMRDGQVAQLARVLIGGPRVVKIGTQTTTRTVEQPAERMAFASRQEALLDTLRLSSTCSTVRGPLAIVNGTVLRIGDDMSGFLVREIRQREIVLENEDGLVTIGMEEISGL